jgi:signal transduction histidine kinase
MPLPALGDVVDAVGFAAAGEYKPVLQDAKLRRGRSGTPPPATAITPADGMSGRYDSRLVTLEAQLLDSVRGSDEQQHLLMRGGPYVFTAILPAHVEIRPGSQLRLTGICAVGRGELSLPELTFRLLLRTPADVVVLRAASWWNTRNAAWVVITMIGVVGLSLAWVKTLRRRVRTQSAFIWQRVKRETEIRERQRIARDLHDTLEQNLAGIALTVQAAQRALPARSAVAVERHLAMALKEVYGGIDELQRAVWALREQSLETRGLASALDDIGKQLTNCSPSTIQVVTHVEGDPQPFPAAVENDLLRIGQEAITNALRHGKAGHIEVHLTYGPETFRLRVSDDGRGFDVDVPAPEGHFGLMGMRERAAAIGARLEVRSSTGRGTEIEVTLPLERLLTLPQAG